MSSLIHFGSRGNDFLPGVEGDGRKRKRPFLGYGRNSYLVLVLLLEPRDWLKSGDDFDLSVDDLGESKSTPVSGGSEFSGSFIEGLRF